MKNPLLAPGVCLATGVVVARFLPFAGTELIAGISGLLVLACLAKWKSTARAVSACVLTAIVLAGAGIALIHRPGPAPRLNAESNEIVLLEGCVSEPPALGEDRQSILLQIARRARVRVSIPQRPEEPTLQLHYGQIVRVAGKIRMPRNFGNPGAFDYVTYLARQDVYWTAAAHGSSSVSVLQGSCATRFWSAVYGVRALALERLEKFYQGDAYATGMMEAMLLGDSSKLQKVWTEDFRNTGTYHALVISGIHVSVIAGTLLFAMRVLFVPAQISIWIAGMVAWFYALMTGWQPPVVRSAGGFTLFLIARLLYRRGRILNLLAAVAIGFILLDPDQLFDASFQLSFLSVAAIGAIASPILEATTGALRGGLRGLSDPDRDLHVAPRVAAFRIEMRLICETVSLWTRWPVERIAPVWTVCLALLFHAYEMILISLMIQISLALPMIVYFHRVSFTALTANVLIVPALTAAVPIGFLGIAMNWSMAAEIARWLLRLSQAIAGWHLRWEPGWRIPDPPLWLGLVFVGVLISFAIALSSRPRYRWTAFAGVAIVFVLLCSDPFRTHAAGGTLEFDAIDVAQGDSLLISLPDGQLMLVDAGGFPVFGDHPKPNLDIGEDVVSPYLWSRGITHIDVIAMTHAHEDHVGGMAAVISNFHPRELWTGANSEESPVWQTLRAKAIQSGVRIVPMRTGDQRRFGNARVDVIAPSREYAPARAAKNNDSLVLKLAFGRHTFLLTGDIERPVEESLIAEARLAKVDVLKIAHHGSRTSSTQEFLDAVQPAFAVISVGADNSYGHPTAEVLGRLASRHTMILRTDRLGLIRFRSDGHNLELDTNSWMQRAAPHLLPVFGD